MIGVYCPLLTLSLRLSTYSCLCFVLNSALLRACRRLCSAWLTLVKVAIELLLFGCFCATEAADYDRLWPSNLLLWNCRPFERSLELLLYFKKFFWTRSSVDLRLTYAPDTREISTYAGCNFETDFYCALAAAIWLKDCDSSYSLYKASCLTNCALLRLPLVTPDDVDALKFLVIF